MTCLHTLLVFICYFITNVFTNELVFENCGNNGWTCVNNTNSNIDVTFSCSEELQKNHESFLWEFKGLPTRTESVTIKDCDATIFVGIKTVHVAAGKYPHLRGFIIKNVPELVINETTFSIPEILKGISEVKFENIKHISYFNKNSIGGSVLDSSVMKGFTFEMKDVQIDTVKDRSVWWSEGDIPFKMIWDNVTVNQVEENAIHISDTKKNPKTQVLIRNSKFGELKKKSFNVHSTDFQFTDNEVQLVAKSAFRIQSDSTSFLRNNFYHISNYAFLFVNIASSNKNLKFESNTIHNADKLSMNFGAPYYNELEGKVSFRDNKFNCINSTWLQRSDTEKIANSGGEEEEVQYVKYLKKVEKIVLDNNENICISLPCTISLLKFKDLHAKNEPGKKYCD